MIHAFTERSRNAFLAAIALTTVLLFTLSGCATGKNIKTYDEYNPEINFSKYQTFSFISEHPMIVGETAAPVSPLLEGRIMRVIRANLSRKGFRYVSNPNEADMVISFTIGSRAQIKVDQYPVSYRAAYGRYYRPYGYGMSYGTETRVRNYTEGQLAIDIFDVRTKTPAFHGSSSTRITDADREDPAALTDQIVTETLDGFPPGGSNIAQPNLVPLSQSPSQ